MIMGVLRCIQEYSVWATTVMQNCGGRKSVSVTHGEEDSVGWT